VTGAVAVIWPLDDGESHACNRAGLALQAVTPGWSRPVVTVLAGIATTLIACSPFVFQWLLQFVALYGLLLMPVGAVVVVEHWVFRRIGLTPYWAANAGRALNWPALCAWVLAWGCRSFCIRPVWSTNLFGDSGVDRHGDDVYRVGGGRGARQAHRSAAEPMVEHRHPAVVQEPRRAVSGHSALSQHRSLVLMEQRPGGASVSGGLRGPPGLGICDGGRRARGAPGDLQNGLLWASGVHLMAATVWIAAKEGSREHD